MYYSRQTRGYTNMTHILDVAMLGYMRMEERRHEPGNAGSL